MIPKNPEQWQKIDRFFMSFTGRDRIAIIYDSDPDGLGSAVLLNKAIKKMRGKPAQLLLSTEGIRNTISEKTFNALKKNRITKAIFADLGVHEDRKAVKKLESQCKILVIDHHQFFHDITSEKTVLAMPQLLAEDIEPSKYNASKLTYDLVHRHSDMSDYSWVAALGIISDMASSAWEGFLERVFERNSMCKKEKWYQTKLGKIAGMLFAAMTIDEKNIDYCLKALMNAEKPADLLKDRKLNHLRQMFDRDINSWVRKLPSAEKHSRIKLLWFEIDSKYRINSPLSTIISLMPEFRDWVVMIVEARENLVKVSARCQAMRVKTNELLKAAVKGLKNASGGGHIPAAGATVQKKDLPEFKRRIIRFLSKNLYTTKEIKQ